MNTLLVLPILVPFVTAILCLFAWQHTTIQRWLSVIGTASLLVVGLILLHIVYRDGIQAVQIGSWTAPFGITVVVDLFSAIMVSITGLMGLLVVVYSLGSIDLERQRFGYYPLFCTLLMGVSGAFITGDLFNLYVWFEVLLISSFVLMALGGERRQLAGAIQYVVMNLISSSIFLAALGIVYSVTGTLNMADLALQIQQVQQPGIVTILAIMFLIAFGIKAAIFPLFFWLPASYDTPPIAVTAIFAALLTKVGVYALVRIFTLIFVHEMNGLREVMLVLAGLTMIVGVFGAASEYEFRRVLSFHIVSQIGYMLMGLALFTPLALAGTIYFLLHNILAKTNLFLISGVAQRLQGSYELKKMGGLYKNYPILGVLFLIPAFSLAGIPPLSGFWGKLLLVRAGLEVEQYLVVGISLFVSVWTTYSMLKLWSEAFLKDSPQTDRPAQGLWQVGLVLLLPIIILSLLTVLMGILAEPVVALTQRAANQLMNPSDYIQAVLKG